MKVIYIFNRKRLTVSLNLCQSHLIRSRLSNLHKGVMRLLANMYFVPNSRETFMILKGYLKRNSLFSFVSIEKTVQFLLQISPAKFENLNLWTLSLCFKDSAYLSELLLPDINNRCESKTIKLWKHVLKFTAVFP